MCVCVVLRVVPLSCCCSLFRQALHQHVRSGYRAAHSFLESPPCSGLLPVNRYVCPYRPLSSSCLGLPYRVLNINHKKELLSGLWVERLSRPSHASKVAWHLLRRDAVLRGISCEGMLWEVPPRAGLSGPRTACPYSYTAFQLQG